MGREGGGKQTRNRRGRELGRKVNSPDETDSTPQFDATFTKIGFTLSLLVGV